MAVSRRRIVVVVVSGTRANGPSHSGELSRPVSQLCSVDTRPLPSGSRAAANQR